MKKSALSHSNPPGNASLVCVVGQDQGKVYPITKPRTIFGRAPQCDVRVDTGLVSRKHAIIAYESGYYVLYDQNSTNGTWVNGQRIMEHILKASERIQIGPSIFVMQIPSDQANDSLTPTPTPPGLKNVGLSSGIYTRNLAEYELLETWSGGMADVYKGRSRSSGQIVAIKVLRSQDPYIKDKFIKEIEVGKNLRHPHIVQVLGGGQNEGKWFMVMEFMDGQTLAEQIQRGQPVPIGMAVQVVGQMCDALAYAHQRGVYHRDIKPANILFNTSQTAKLGDFGIARLAQAVTMTMKGAILGTPKYMSYEQALGLKVDHRSDLYSLGVVFYQLLTGYPPFEDKDPLKLIDCHVKYQPRPPRQINPNIPPHLEQAVLKALAKKSAERFQDAEEMAQAIGHRLSRYRTSSDLPAVSLKLVTANNQTIPLNQGTTILGREIINLQDNEISRRHAKVVYRSGRWWLEDNNSTNGTFVNNRRVAEPVLLQPEDEIVLGNTTLRVRLG